MKNTFFKQGVCSLTLLTFLYSPYGFAVKPSQCKQDSKKLQDQARGMGQAAAAQQGVAAKAVGQSVAGSNQIERESGTLKNFGNASGNHSTATADEVAKLREQCQKACDPGSAEDENGDNKKESERAQIEQEKNQCEQEIAKVEEELRKSANEAYKSADQAGQSQQAAQSGSQPGNNDSSGGMGGMGGGLLGAALGAGLAMMMMKKKDKKDEALFSADGTVNCKANGAVAYSDCNDYFLEQCKTDSTSAVCKQFTGRYCSTSTTASSSNPDLIQNVNTSESGVIIASKEDKDIKGEGMGSQFCFKSQATEYCASSGRENCPSCLQLEANKSAACDSNPALCMLQHDPQTIQNAKNSCPTDPMFSNPTYTSGGGSTVPGGGGLEDPILPNQYASSEGSTNETATGNQATTSGVSIASVGGGGGSMGFVSSGEANPDTESSWDSYRSRRSSRSSYGSGSVGRSGSGSRGSDTRAPSNYGSAVGPSLFSVSTDLIQGKCALGQLAHCSR